MIWKRKGDNHELFRDEKKVGTIRATMIKKLDPRPWETVCDCPGCIGKTSAVIYTCYFKGKKIETFNSSEMTLPAAKEFLENWIKNNA